MILRTFFWLSLFLGVLFFPLPVVLVFFVFAFTFLNNFFEGIIAGFFLDALYFFPVPITVVFIASAFLMNWAKSLIQAENFVSKFIVAGLGGFVFILAVVLFY